MGCDQSRQCESICFRIFELLLFCVFTGFYSLSCLSVCRLITNYKYDFYLFIYFIIRIFFKFFKQLHFVCNQPTLDVLSVLYSPGFLVPSHKSKQKTNGSSSKPTLSSEMTQTVIPVKLLVLLLLPTLIADWLHSRNKNLTCQPMPAR